MLPAQVVGHAVATTSHPSLKGCRLLLCQQVDGVGGTVGAPFVAIDTFGAGMHSAVFVSTDGIGARALLEDDKSPVRMFVQGVAD